VSEATQGKGETLGVSVCQGFIGRGPSQARSLLGSMDKLSLKESLLHQLHASYLYAQNGRRPFPNIMMTSNTRQSGSLPTSPRFKT
jgi:hypothetical protein